jgi:hypothetical protein
LRHAVIDGAAGFVLLELANPRATSLDGLLLIVALQDNDFKCGLDQVVQAVTGLFRQVGF